ncbi:MAG: UPF0149 family protein [Nitrospira sp.]|nr:UPF0149 family protein [Nitrospira sp.]
MDTIPHFTASHAALLQTFLSSPERPAGTLTYPQLAGFLFSIANSPELIPPSEWIPMVFNDQEGGFETPGEAEGVIQAMMALHNDCCRARSEGSTPIPLGCEIRPQAMDNLAEDAPLSQWAQGFSMGYDYLEESWNDYTTDELDEELGSLLMVLTFFSSPKLAKAYHEEGTGKRSLAEMADTVVTLFPEAMRAVAHLGRSIYQARYEAGAFEEPMPLRPKIGRNEPCPCGSGKKFKKCCGAN